MLLACFLQSEATSCLGTGNGGESGRSRESRKSKESKNSRLLLRSRIIQIPTVSDYVNNKEGRRGPIPRPVNADVSSAR